jgi:hypothetical protein
MKLVSVGAFLSVALAAGAASADDPKGLAPPSVALHATPIFGQDAASGYGWTEVIARIDNAGSAAQKGNLDLTSAVAYGREQELVTRAPFHVAAGRSVVVHVPTHGYAYQPATLSLTAVREDGAKLASVTVSVNASTAPLLVDVDEPSKLSIALRNLPVPTGWSGAAPGGSTATTPLTMGAVAFDGTSGDPILPEQAAGYAAATAVLIHSDALARLEPGPRDALVNWVLSGGTLAVVPSRPEDLSGPTLTALVGGAVTPAEPPPLLFSLPAMPSTVASSPFAAPVPSPAGSGEEIQKAPPGESQPRIGPASGVRPRLVGYTGGNLHASPYGATAPYGMGEVHLLPFDPTTPPAIDDLWVQARLVDLLARAWDRRATTAFRQGTLPQNPYQLSGVRRWLDPNENFRPALGIAAILLVVYSIVSGPVTFLRASKGRRPLAPLKWAPLWSAVTFAAVVVVGLACKGWRGRARHVSLVEAGAGVSRGAIRRFRGFFTSEAQAMSIGTTDGSCVLDVVGDEAVKDRRVFRVDRNGGALEHLTSLPWQTIVAVEDGSVELGSGVSLVPSPDGTVQIVNRSGRALRDVFLFAPGKDPTYFAVLKDGEHESSGSGTIMRSFSGHATTAGARRVHPLEASDLGPRLDVHTSTRLRETWQPLETAAGGEVDWIPDDVPVLFAQVEGGEGVHQDSSLSVEEDRVLLRVVGPGGWGVSPKEAGGP